MRKANQADMPDEWKLLGESWNIYKMFRFAKTDTEVSQFVEHIANWHEKNRGSPVEQFQVDVMNALQDGLDVKFDLKEQTAFHPASTEEIKNDQIVFADVLRFMQTYYFCETDADLEEMKLAAEELWQKHEPDVLCKALAMAVVDELDRKVTRRKHDL